MDIERLKYLFLDAVLQRFEAEVKHAPQEKVNEILVRYNALNEVLRSVADIPAGDIQFWVSLAREAFQDAKSYHGAMAILKSQGVVR